MPKLTLSFGKDEEGKRIVKDFSAELPDGTKVDVVREGDNITFNLDTDDSTLIAKIMDFLRHPGDMPGISDEV